MSDNQLTKQVRAFLKQGKSKEEIYLSLLHRGKTVNEITSAFQQAAKAAHSKPVQQKKMVYLLLLFGVVLVGMGVFSFIAANWRAMSKAFKLVLILALMLVCYAAGWHLKENRKLKRSGEALILVGALIYGAAIFLTAQIFNIHTQWPDGFVLWMGGALLLTYAFDKMWSLYYLALWLGAAVILGYPGVWSRRGPAGGFLSTPPVLLFAAAVAAWITARRLSVLGGKNKKSL